ncbi:BMP family ABC transporter substrate-binding protein [Muricomes intestini]|jgi:basic membrane protein A|uniref:BMP family lipoprotein n=1 Tax=Muricomes intestini TaxID=1796634 RepID=UPI0026A01E09
MKKAGKSLSVLLAAAMIAGSLTACGGGKDDGRADSGEKKDVKIAIVCDSAGQNDNGYNQTAVEGAKKAADELGVEYKVVEPENGVPAALETLAEDGYNVIFNLEYDFDALIKGVGGSEPIAVMYPDTTFVCVNDNPNQYDDGNVIHDNVICALFDVHEASYIAGALSVQVLENKDILFPAENYSFTDLDKGGRTIGFVGGTNSNGITVFSDGFIEGINKAAEDLGVNYDYYAKYDAGFSDPATGSTVAGTYYNQGANVVYAVAGSVGDGVASKAKEEKKLAIHVDADKDDMQPGYILTSVIKNTSVPVYDITKAYVDGTIDDMDRLQTFPLASGATDITELTQIKQAIADTDEAQAKWEEIMTYIDDLKTQIADGKIKVTNAQIGEAFDPSACKNVTIK